MLLVGLPGSGKTTFYRERLAATHIHVSRDLNPGETPRRQQLRVAEALAAGRAVAVDNTHPRRADRQPLLQIGRRHGARVVGFWLDAPVADCRARNRLRTGAGRVPDVAIHTAAKRLEPPAADEGFDALFRVTVAPGGGFEVVPLR